MSEAAARAMDDLADCLHEEACALPPGMAFATLSAMARAHRAAAVKIRARAAAGPVTCPPEYQAGGAGTRR